MTKYSDRLHLHLDMTYLLDDYLPTEVLLDTAKINIKEVIVETIESMTVPEHPKAPVLEDDTRLPYQRLADEVCDRLLYAAIDPQDFKSDDFNDIVRVVRALVVQTYVCFGEFLHRYDITDPQLSSIGIIRWVNKTLVLSIDMQ